MHTPITPDELDDLARNLKDSAEILGSLAAGMRETGMKYMKVEWTDVRRRIVPTMVTFADNTEAVYKRRKRAFESQQIENDEVG